MNQINIQYHKTKIGELILGSFAQRLCMLDFRYRKMRSVVDNRIRKGLNAEFREQDDDTLSQARAELDDYLNGNRTCFDIPIIMVGTDFQKNIWKALLQVQYGKTVSYAELSKTVSNENAVRAVANANGANAIAVIIPCHRVIGSSGELVGYGGGISIKKRLLKLELQNACLSDDEKYNFLGSRNVKYDGIFYVAVKTTKIFCRPSCSARRPKQENIVFTQQKKKQ